MQERESSGYLVDVEKTFLMWKWFFQTGEVLSEIVTSVFFDRHDSEWEPNFRHSDDFVDSDYILRVWFKRGDISGLLKSFESAF